MNTAEAILDRPPIDSEKQNHSRTHSPLPPPSIAILGIAFDPVTLAQALERIEEMITSRQPHYVVTANVDFLVQARRDVELRRILFDAHLVLCDGTPLLWASRLLGNPLPERVAGADLVPELIRVAAKKAYRLFFLGASPEANAQAVNRVRAQFPNVNVVGCFAPPFRPLLEMDHDEMVHQIRAARPDLLFVSFGCPKAEKWMAMHYRALGVPITIGVGATIDFLAGRVKRAPLWMQRAGVEWIFRLCQEPRRLLRRYATDLGHFGWAMTTQWWQMQFRQSDSTVSDGIWPVISEVKWQRLAVVGRLDAGTVRAQGPLWQSVGNGHCLLDLAGVRFMDSTGLAWLISLEKRLRAAQQQLVLIAPSAAVQRTLRLMRVIDFFTVAQDAVEARQLIEARRAEELSVVKTNGRRPLAWRGEITAANAAQLWELIEPRLRFLSSCQKQLTIDLTDVRFIDSAGLRLMLRAKRDAQRQGAVLHFAGTQANVRNVLRQAKLEEVLIGEAA